MAVRFSLERFLDVPALDGAVSEVFTKETLCAVAHAVTSVANNWDSLKFGA